MRVSGLATGIDTESLVKEMMTVQKMPMDKLMQQKTWMEWQKDSFRDTNLAFSNLRTKASDMRLQSTFNSYAASSTAPTKATAETTATSVSGSYRIEVASLASGAKVHSADTIKTIADPTKSAKSTDAIGVAGSVTIKGTGANAQDIIVDIAETDTYDAVAKKLKDATAGKVPELRVSFDNTTSRFFMSTKELGADQNFEMTFSTPELAAQVVNAKEADGTTIKTQFTTAAAPAVGYMASAANGSMTFDGITVDNLTANKTTINGLTINLLEVGETTITVNADSTKTFEKIKDFVQKYNETIADLEKQLVEKRYPNFQPLTAEQKKELGENEVELWEEKARSGLLRNDPILRSAVQELRRSFMNPVEGIAAGNINLLSQIGISTGSYTDGGKLFIDEDKLKDVLTKKPDEVMALFTNRIDGANVGVGGRVYETLNNTIKSLSDKAGSPSSLVDKSQISKTIKRMDDEISRWQDRLGRIEDRYWKQFTAMEKAISQMNSQSTWLQQTLGGM